MRKYKKLTALILAIAMMLTIAGCGDSNKQTEQSKSSQAEGNTKVEESSKAEESSKVEEPLEITKITLYPNNANLTSGIKDGHIKELFAKHGLEVEVWAYSDDKTNAILTSGDLPDVMYVKADNLETMIESELILNLDEHLDKLPALAENDALTGALNYMREFRSGDTGNLYAVPTHIGDGVNKGTTDRLQLMLFWDYYVELGLPEIEDVYQLIDVYKQMKENHPKDALGNETYAVSTYYDAQNPNFIRGYASMFGYSHDFYKWFVAPNNVTGEEEYLMAENGVLYEGLKWLNALYKEGLFDPNSINQDRPTLMTKVWENGQNGTYFSCQADTGGDNNYYKPIYFPGEFVVHSLTSPFGSSNEFVVVNANSENIDAALRLVNLMADPIAELEWKYGPEGEAWYVKEGTNEVYPTERYMEWLTSGTSEPFVLSTGESMSLYNTNRLIGGGVLSSYVDAEGNPRACQMDAWDEILLASDNLERQVAWREHYGYDNWFALLEDNNALALNSKWAKVTTFMPANSDEQKLTMSAVMDKVVTYSWKMIYAESEAEFESNWNSLLKDTEGLGAKDIYNWAVEEIEKAIEVRDELLGK